MDTAPGTIINASKMYYTWNAFKRDVELNLGHYVNNNLWIQAKPKKPLPWYYSDIADTVLYIKKVDGVS